MEFCPKCGALMMSSGSGSSCPKCNHQSKDKIDMEIKESVKASQGVAVVSENDAQVHPITDYECEKCGNDKAYFWLRQMRAGDEPESKFYKCTKCKNTVRED